MTDYLILPPDKGLSLPVTDGFGQMIVDQGRFLYWDPHVGNNTADKMWQEHSEELLRIRIAHELVTKKVEDE